MAITGLLILLSERPKKPVITVTDKGNYRNITRNRKQEEHLEHPRKGIKHVECPRKWDQTVKITQKSPKKIANYDQYNHS